MIHSLTSGDRRCQVVTSSCSAASVQTVCNHWHPCSTQVACGGTTCGIWEAGAIPAASTSCVISHSIVEAYACNERGFVSCFHRFRASLTMDG
jgi:hypothetical protein